MILRLHFDVAIYSRKYGCSRGKGKEAKQKAAAKRPRGYSILASAAYQSGEKLRDEARGIIFDFRGSRSRRQDDVLYKEILAPDHAPAWVKDRQQLHNKLEAAENRADAQLARSIVGVLPRILTLEQNIELVRGFVHEHLTRYGMVADIAIHSPSASDGKPNIHCHMLVSLRDIEGEGFGQKNREWNQWNASQKKAQSVDPLRDAWALACNDALQKAGRKERVSLQSFAKEGIDDRTPEIHLGYQDGNKEKRGVRSEKGDKNRKIRHDNQVRDAIDGLREPRKSDRKSKEVPARREPWQSAPGAARRNLAEIAAESKPEGGKPQKAMDKKQQAQQVVIKIFRAGSRVLDKATLKAMDYSYRQDAGRKRLKAAVSRYSLLRSSRELSEELEERKGKTHER